MTHPKLVTPELLGERRCALICDLADQISQQDNRSTSHPVFQVVTNRDAGSQYVRDVHDVFLTNGAAEAYVSKHRHNFPDAYVYVASGYRNEEWQRLRALILELAEEIGGMVERE